MIEPFLKWAGGKRWLIHKYGHLFPYQFKRYLEPFLGSGAVFFKLCPKEAILADSNAELINVYQQVQASAALIAKSLHRYQQLHCEDFYYECRSRKPQSALERAILFIYLNRTCWNGLYRVNQCGNFNVPIGTKTLVTYPDHYLQKVSSFLSNAKIITADFEQVIGEACADDLMYVDPPYTVTHNANNFIKYNARLFSWDDQVRLSIAVKKAASRGALVMISNANHECIRDLYAGFGVHHCVERTSVLSAKAVHRQKTTELLIANFKNERI